MPQDAFTIRYIADELKSELAGGKISRIIQPARDFLTFIIYTRKGNLKLDACLSARSARLSLGEGERPVPQVAPNFCMLLRKHLQNAEILDIVQPDFERIIYFDLKCVSDFSSTVMRLYFEIMGKYSNAVLTENGVIVGALKTSAIGENTKRVLFGGVKYVPPEPQDKIAPDDIEELTKALKSAGDKTEFLSGRVKGLAYATAVEMVEAYGENITAQNIYDYIFKEKAEPCVTYSDGQPTDFKVRSKSQSQKRYASILEAQCAYYSYEYEKASFRERKTKLESALGGAVKKAEKRLAIENEKLLECSGAENIKLKGELITANIYAIERGATSFKAINYYDPNGGEIKIDLDRALTPSQNAQKYYKKYAKLKRTQTAVTAQKKETEKRLDYLKSIAANISAAEKIADFAETEEELISLGLLKQPAVKNKKVVTPPYRTYILDGFKIISGRNNLQNDRLTKSLAQDDIWLHTQKYHSSHVAIITEGKTIPDSVLLTAAEICAYYSDGREGNKIPVDYTKKKFVKKPPATNAGFAIYTDYSTILVNPDPHTELINE
ncbi:MAG: NFACT family protein [Clostridia bacterium]|nr:NFACT family protein [Clostridia bacterium]